VDVDGHGGMRLAGGAAEVLRGERTVELRRDPVPVRAPRERRRRGAAAAELESDADRRLFEALRLRRLELARENSLAPFMVFPDRTLLEMARHRPDSGAGLESLHGIGRTKRERWGDEFLAVIRSFTGTS